MRSVDHVTDDTGKNIPEPVHFTRAQLTASTSAALDQKQRRYERLAQLFGATHTGTVCKGLEPSGLTTKMQNTSSKKIDLAGHHQDMLYNLEKFNG